MRIALISSMAGAPWGGSEVLWAEMAELALGAGHQVHLSLKKWPQTHPTIEKLQKLGAVIHYRKEPKSRTARVVAKIVKRLPPRYQVYLTSPFRSVFNARPSIVCINEGIIYSTVDFRDLHYLLARSGVPFLLLTHLNEESLLLSESVRRQASEIISRADVNAFVSKRIHTLAERQLARSVPNFTILQNPVNLPEIRYVEWPASPTVTFASVARLEAKFKGQDVMFEALANNIWKHRDWRLNLFGDGPDRGYLLDLARYYGILDRVTFCGHVNDIRAVWSTHHALLLPSRDEGGPPISLAEAMLCGRPVVATDVGAVREWVQDGTSGIIVPAATADLFVDAMERFWRLRDRWFEMGRKAHERATNKLDRFPGRTLLQLLERISSPPEGIQ